MTDKMNDIINTRYKNVYQCLKSKIFTNVCTILIIMHMNLLFSYTE